MTQWTELFEQVRATGSIDGKVIEARPQQVALGQAVVETIAAKERLLAQAATGTGKSLAYLVPAIDAAKRGKRTVVSTETLALMDQLVDKDLPFLHRVYGGFGYRALKGRAWYLCRNRMVGARSTYPGLVKEIEDLLDGRLGDGERRDVERALRRKLPDEEWSYLGGDSNFCAENKCAAKRCYSARARELALDADIVVTSHAMLRTDAELRAVMDSDILGRIDVLIVDEAHTLEQVLIDGWSETVSTYDLVQAEAAIVDGLQKALMDGQWFDRVDNTFRDIERALRAIQRFLSLREPESLENWTRANFAIKEHVLYGGDPELIEAMTAYETYTPKTLMTAYETLERLSKHLHAEAADAERGARKMRKGANAAHRVALVCRTVAEAVPTRDGIVMRYGAPFAVLAYGREWFSKKERKTHREIEIRCIPIDVSERIKEFILADRACVFLSATLSDPADGSFTYAMRSLGMTEARTLQADSPFDYANNQLIYVTPARLPAEPVRGARFSAAELFDLIEAANGRTLALFTARDELDHAAELLRGEQRRGNFKWPILVQEKGVNKQDLVNDFTSIEHSVLLATRSFFTGVNFPGTTCSMVVIAKAPLPQYNALCKAKIEWWKRRGFASWYERESLLVFAQAAGRLIRAESDRGVVAVLDQRVANPRERVHHTMMIGIRQTGSPVTSRVEDVRAFLAQS